MNGDLSLYNRLRRLAGRSAVTPAPSLPRSWIPRVTAELIPEVMRGLLRTRHLVLLGSRVRIRAARRVSWGRGCRIGRGSTVDGYSIDGVRFGAGSRLGDYSVVTCTSHVTRMGRGLRIGARSGFGDYCHFGASGGIDIGDDVLAGGYVSFHAQNHLYEDPLALIRDQGVNEAGIKIGSDCWIGAKVTFLDGSEIGDGCVVAAGSVVAGQFPDRSLIAGTPARLIRQIRQGDVHRTEL